ncbi:TetR/AcrR family transcriptional regulator [Actinoplanes subglobosus]|uniref:TetR/AcrR family transcriptional regulator n=1 Tax=Actinoplanes subglobosus TaxID=1547892 RepID=A0ABV8IH62_9ACTN
MTETPARRRAPGMSPEARREMIVAAALPLLVEHGATVGTLQIAKAAGIGEATIFRVFTDKDELLEACVVAALRNDHVLAELDAVPLDQPLVARLTEAAATLHAYLHRMGAVTAAVHAAGRRVVPPTHAPGGPARGVAPAGHAPGDSARGVAPAGHAPGDSARGVVSAGHAPGDSARGGAPAGHAPGSADRGASVGPGLGVSGQGRGGSGRGLGASREEASERTRQAVIRLLEPDRDALRLPVEQLAAVFLGMLFSRPGAPAADTPIETLVDIFLHGVVTPGVPS